MKHKLMPSLILIDLETTGTDDTKHEIVDTCAVILSRKLEVIDRFSIMSHPDHIDTATEFALKLNGYNYEKWQSNGAVEQKTLAHMLHVFICDTIGNRNYKLIPTGHRVKFDYGFLMALMNRFNLELPIDNRRFIDTLVLEDSIRIAQSISENKYLRPSAQSFKRLAYKYNVPLGNKHHTAEGDVNATLEILRHQINLIKTGVERKHRNKKRKR